MCVWECVEGLLSVFFLLKQTNRCFLFTPLYVILLSKCRITGRYPNVAHVPYTLAPKAGRWIDRQLCTNQQTDGLTNHQKGRQMFR